MKQLDMLVIECTNCGREYKTPFDTNLFMTSEIYKKVYYRCAKCKTQITITRDNINKYLEKKNG